MYATQDEDHGGCLSKSKGNITYQYKSRYKGSTPLKQKIQALKDYKKMRSILPSEWESGHHGPSQVMKDMVYILVLVLIPIPIATISAYRR